MSQLPTVLLFQTHFFDRGAARLFERLRRQCPPHFECVVLMHVPAGTPKPRRLAAVPHHFVSTPEIRALDYPRKTADRDWTGRSWEFWGGGHSDLVPMHFYNAYPHFARYWVIEYDVRFTGNWRTLFDAFEDSGSDFLSTSIRRRRDNPVWVNWESVQGPAPESEIERHRVAVFPPIFRANQAAMARMDAAYRAGWGGHLEAAWAASWRSTGSRWRTSAATASSSARAIATASTRRRSTTRNATCCRPAPSWPSRRCSDPAARPTGSTTR